MDNAMLTHTLFALLGGLASADPTWLLPTYHFTRASNHMNDPNGLLWTRAPNGSVAYHMYFQSSDPGQAPGSIWGHAVSPDMVHWTRMPRTGMRGSSGGAVALPEDFTPPAELHEAKAVALSSVPMSPSQDPPTGLHLWYSTDDQLMEWTEYRNESSVQNSTNQSCVICPEDVPTEAKPGYIGDNYMWHERTTDPSGSTQHTFFVLDGSTRCAVGFPWCSYEGLGGNSSAQAFVFSSQDLLHWELVSNWDFLPKQGAWPAGFANTTASQWPSQRIDTPDTFAVTDAATNATSQAFVWLGSPGCNTHWMLGQLNETTKAFAPSTHIGCADLGVFVCQQSLTTPTGSRVSIGWVPLSGDGWDGAQSLPRVITVDNSGLLYTPLDAVQTLHLDYHFWRDHRLQNSTVEALDDISLFGAQAHLRIRPHMTLDQTFSLSLLGGVCVVNVSYRSPDQCQNSEILNNTDTNGQGSIAKSVPANSSYTADWCRQICCADQTCAAWTFTDPQPDISGPATYDCWNKLAGSTTFPSSCSDGHCWSGVVDRGSWQVTVNGTVLGNVRPSPDLGSVEVFVDGAIVEVYFGGEVVTSLFPQAVSQNVTLSSEGPGEVVLQLDAWRMDTAIAVSYTHLTLPTKRIV
eukprot:TRINITY_DN13743_c0_g1_i1.p1 TRINITY_DN13743_c0_g1~~TRINITY_DN13743_c0_g1_i1.p1  ORF type:complete len:632 (-),score=111.27 TRINITY_DN13743_c0_g1_i1:91-1986(-)